MANSDALSCFTPGSVTAGNSAALPGSIQRNVEQGNADPNSADAAAVGQSPTLDITVAIPTYNGAERLPLVLDQLRSQIDTDSISWEVIVCDNSSTDDTATVVRDYQSDWPAQFALHYRFAAEKGAAFARQRAVEVAQGGLIAFLDDDNIPTDDWVAQVYRFARSHPQAGAFGSQIHGQFETELPSELSDLKCFLAIIERGSEPRRYEPAKKILPPAAGLVVRRQVWLEAVPARLFLNNKGKGAGLASEDLEALLYIQKAGWEVWYNPDMVVYHHIPESRLRPDYLIDLLRCVGLSRFHIRLLGLSGWQRPLAIPAYIANDIRKLLLHYLRYGGRSPLTTVERCNRHLLTSILASPLFLLKKACKDSLQTYQDQRHSDRRRWLKQITQAFEEDRFALYQQPVMAISTAGEGISRQPLLVGQRELLLRLYSEGTGNEGSRYVLPDRFLPTARRYGLMRTVDRWVIRRLFGWVKQESHRPAFAAEVAHLHGSPMYSVNLSQDSVTDPSLVPFIASNLEKNKLSPHLFCFEVTAATATAWPAQTQQLMADLHQLGCQTTLDDATLGLTTATLVANLPLDYVKFTPTAAQLACQQDNPLRRQLRQTLSQTMCDQPVKAIAKGIDSKATLQTVQQEGILYAQGDQIERPQPLKTSLN